MGVQCLLSCLCLLVGAQLLEKYGCSGFHLDARPPKLVFPIFLRISPHYKSLGQRARQIEELCVYGRAFSVSVSGYQILLVYIVAVNEFALRPALRSVKFMHGYGAMRIYKQLTVTSLSKGQVPYL